MPRNENLLEALKLLQPQQEEAEQNYFKQNTQQPGGIMNTLGQLISTGTTGAAGALADLPYNMINFIPSLIQKTALGAGEFVGEKLGFDIPKGKEREALNQKILQASRNARIGGQGPHPLLGETAEFIDEITGGMTAPKTPAQQTYRDVAGTLATILATEGLGEAPALLERAGKLGKGAWQALRAGGSTGIHKLGLPDIVEAPLQLLFMATTGNPQALSKAETARTALYDTSNGISKGRHVEEGIWSKPLKSLEKDASVTAPGMGQVKGLINDIKNAIKDGFAEVDVLKKIKRAANEWKYNKELGSEAKGVLEKTLNVLREGIDTFGEMEPEHAHAWNAAESLHTGLTNHSFLTQTLMDASEFNPNKYNFKNISTKILFGMPEILAGKLTGTTAAKMVGLKAGTSLMKTYDLLRQSPTAWKDYKSAIKAGAAGDAAAVVSHAKKVDNYFESKEKKNTQDYLKNKKTW